MIGVLSLIDLTAIGFVCVVVVLALWRTNRSLKIQVGNVQASVDTAAQAATTASKKVDAAAAIVEQVNKAVNCRPDTDPTLYEMVKAQGLRLDDLAVSSRRTAEKTEDVAVRLTAHLAHHQSMTDKG